MPGCATHENLLFSLNVESPTAEPFCVWIDRVFFNSPQGPSVTDLHERLTVIASAEAARRRQPFDQVFAAIAVTPGSSMEVRTEYGDAVTVERRVDGSAMYETNTKLPVRAGDSDLGLVGQINTRNEMAQLVELFHATPARLRSRVSTDADLISLARTPLDQLFSLASRITADETALSETSTKHSDLSDTMKEREIREQSIIEQFDVHTEESKKIQVFTWISLAVVAIGIAVAVLASPIVGGALCGLALLLAAFGHFQNKKIERNGGIDGQVADIQLGRVDEMFNNHDLTRSRRAAESSLSESIAEWRSIAGNAKPSALLTDRTRIEELASHLRLIDNENVESADTTLLVGFASLLAELNRRFPAERVPLLVDDLFFEVAPQFHGVLRELIMRASHRRQVVLETGDLTVAKWTAVEAVGGDALLISDFDIDVEPIINQVMAAETQSNV